MPIQIDSHCRQGQMDVLVCFLVYSPVTFMGRPELLNIISTRSASRGMGHVMTVPPPWILLKGSSVGNGGRSDQRPFVRMFKALGVWGLDRGAVGMKADVPCKQRIARIENFISIHCILSLFSMAAIRKYPWQHLQRSHGDRWMWWLVMALGAWRCPPRVTIERPAVMSEDPLSQVRTTKHSLSIF